VYVTRLVVITIGAFCTVHKVIVT